MDRKPGNVFILSEAISILNQGSKAAKIVTLSGAISIPSPVSKATKHVTLSEAKDVRRFTENVALYNELKKEFRTARRILFIVMKPHFTI